MKRKEFPLEIRDLLSSTFWLLGLLAIVSALCSLAYGWVVGIKFFAGASVILALSQLWGSRHDIKAYVARRRSAKRSP